MEKSFCNAWLSIIQSEKGSTNQLDEKIETVLQKLTTASALFHTVFDEWWEFYQKQIKLSTYKTMLATYNGILDKVEKGTKIENMDLRLIQRLLDTEE